MYGRNECAIQSRGVGMFEIVDMAAAVGVTPIVTLCLNETADDMADFVEFIAGYDLVPDAAFNICSDHCSRSCLLFWCALAHLVVCACHQRSLQGREHHLGPQAR